MIRVLIADDSATFRQLLATILAEDADLELVGEARNGEEAIALVDRLRPDIVIMDIHMPLLDGLEATKEIMMRAPTPIVIVSSAIDQRDVGLSLSATQAGALMAMSKPGQLLGGGYDEFSTELRAMVKAMAQVKVVRRWAPALRPSRPPPLEPSRAPQRIRLVAIGASTGGPAALRRILMDLPRDFKAPILIVQHIALGFAAGFAEWLAGSSPLRVKVAESGEPLTGGTVYVAPDGLHLLATKSLRASLSDAGPVSGFRPSISLLFESAARAAGAEVAAVILTGMGTDGVDGLVHVREAGGVVLAQDEPSSIVYGMAKEAVDRGLVDATLPVEDIARQLAQIVCRPGNGA
jgi:two-component system, chemotaxis family, protein-glutamate methylesterase/glutaminase